MLPHMIESCVGPKTVGLRELGKEREKITSLPEEEEEEEETEEGTRQA